jgi:cobalt-zinc-cadmium efflux system outer membrane protein
MEIATGDGSGRRRWTAWLAALLLTSACTAPGLAPEYRALGDALAASDPGPPDEAASASAPARDEDLFSGASSLDRATLVAAVLRRNPTLRAAQQAWRAALARFPQVTALEDPSLAYAVGPRTLAAGGADPSQSLLLRQAIPFPGKLGLRGEVALAEAEVAAHEYEAARLRLATMASLVFDDYYLAERALEVNHHHRAVLRELRAVATARYEAGAVSAQAPLQAEFELASLVRVRATLHANRAVTRAQLNALLHRPPERPLPPPPATLAVPDGPTPSRAQARAAALDGRPELRAAAARVRAGEASVGLARREFLPDFGVMAGYNGFMEDPERRPMLGVEVHVPLQLGRRRAALDEARAQLARAESERSGLEDEVRLAVETGAERVEEARRALALYRDRLVPAARDQLEAARAAFETGQESFIAVLSAEEDLREVELGEYAALADLDRRWALLRSATGALPLP